MTKNQLLDSYIEGDIDTADFIQHMGTKINDKKGIGKNSRHPITHAPNMKRLSEIFKASQPRQPDDKENNPNNVSIMNKTVITLQDFLVDLEEDQTPDPSASTQKKQPHSNITLKQSSLCFNKQQGVESAKQQTLFNYKPQQNLYLTHLITIDEQIPKNKQRIVKSSTFNPQRENTIDMTDSQMITDQQDDKIQDLSSSQIIPRNLSIRRAHSMIININNITYQNIDKPQNIIIDDDNKENVPLMISQDTFDDIDANQGKQMMYVSKSARKESKRATKKRKLIDKDIQPTRVMPQRGCKQNVNYNEDEINLQEIDYIARIINKKRFNY